MSRSDKAFVHEWIVRAPPAPWGSQGGPSRRSCPWARPRARLTLDIHEGVVGGWVCRPVYTPTTMRWIHPDLLCRPWVGRLHQTPGVLGDPNNRFTHTPPQGLGGPGDDKVQGIPSLFPTRVMDSRVVDPDRIRGSSMWVHSPTTPTPTMRSHSRRLPRVPILGLAGRPTPPEWVNPYLEPVVYGGPGGRWSDSRGRGIPRCSPGGSTARGTRVPVPRANHPLGGSGQIHQVG